MKKIFFTCAGKANLPVFALAALVCAGLGACSSDDDGDSAGGETGVITNEDGSRVRVTRAGDYYFSYDEEGLLSAVRDGSSELYEVGQDPFTLEYDQYDETETYTLSRNGKGYITKMTEKYTYDSEDDEEWENGSATLSFSYDGSGHLTKITGSGSGTYYDDGEKEKYNAKLTYTFTWSDNLLTRMKYVGEEDGDKYTVEVEYDYGDNVYENPSHQFANSYWAYSATDVCDILSSLGMLGIGGDYLPVSVTETDTEDYEDEDEDSETYTYNYSYGFNSNGLLTYERCNRSYFYYSYEGVEDSEDEEAKAQRSVAPQRQKDLRPHRLFHRSHRK